MSKTKELNIGHIDDIGTLNLHPELLADSTVAAISQAEVSRTFCAAFGKEAPTASLNAVNVILGLEEYVPPAPDPTTPPSAQSKATPPEPEIAETDPTQEFLNENYHLLRDFLEKLKDKVKISAPYADLAEALYRKKMEIIPNKSIGPAGIIVVPKLDPTKRHVLSPYVSSVEIHNPEETRQILGKLNIKAGNFPHHAETTDAYLCRVHVHTDDFEGVVNAFVTPPDWEVYIAGEDPKFGENNSDKLYTALVHIILESFYTAVVREYDPAKKTDKVKKNGKGTSLEKRIKEVIDEVSHGSFPILVTDWKTPNEHETGDLTEDPSNRKTGTKKAEALAKRFDTVFCAEDKIDALISQGVCIKAVDYIRILPHRSDILPRSAWKDSDSKTVLKGDFEEVYIPIKDPEVLREIIDFLANKHNYNDPNLRRTLNQHFERNFEQLGNAGTAFEKTVSTYYEQMNPYIAGRCSTLFHESKKIKTHSDLFSEVFASARAIDARITPEEVFEAFISLSPLNPERLFIPISGVNDYRLSYKFKNGGSDLPTDDARLIFTGANHELDPQTPMDVVRIIADNRARLTRVTDEWLRGDNRSEGMTWAESIQRTYLSPHSGTQVDLAPLTRALLVYEFETDQGEKRYAYTYMDATRDSTDTEQLTTVKAKDRLINRTPRVVNAIRRAMQENKSGIHSDFQNPNNWSSTELERLEKRGVIRLKRDSHGDIVGIDNSLKVCKKKVVIFKKENIGYRQFEIPPSNLFEYFGHIKRIDQDFPLEINDQSFDHRKLTIQKLFYDLLAA